MSDMIPDHLRHIRVGQSPLTVRDRRRVLLTLHKALPHGLAYATTAELDHWLGTELWSRWTRATYAMHIRAFYRWATEVGWIDWNPAADMARPKTPKLLPKPITDAELARALESPEPWRTVVLLAAFEGLRAFEIAACEREHLTRDALLIPNGKGGKEASVPTHPLVWAALHDRPAGRLVVNRHGDDVDGMWVSARARAYFIRSGQVKVRPHRLRHWYATAMLSAGADLVTVQQNMRHESIASTVGYTKISSAQRVAAVLALPVPGGAPAGA